MWKEFRTFILRGNVIDLAVGIVIGTAFGAIVKSMVDDVIMPPLGVLLGSIDFRDLFVVLIDGTPPPPYANLEAAKAAGAVTLRIGLFVNSVVAFLIMAFVMFLMIRGFNRLSARLAPPAPPPPPGTRECDYCRMQIPVKATRCGFCTSEVRPVSP
jgi:large conductance mechanosensitive channel